MPCVFAYLLPILFKAKAEAKAEAKAKSRAKARVVERVLAAPPSRSLSTNQQRASSRKTQPPLHFDRISTEAAWFRLSSSASEMYPDANIPPGKADMQIHTDDMLIRPGNKFSWVTDALKG
jgi:hypothetical protein